MVRHYLVKGRVQGVGFRWYVQQEAAKIGLRGWVRNTSGGEVEVTASGDEEALQQLLERLKRGSRGSRVDRIEQQDRPQEEAANLEAFEVEGAW